MPSFPKGAKAKPGKRAPTAEEKRWMDAIVAHGCVACILDGQEPRPTTVHHILRGGRRLGHAYSLPLCDPGHHQGGWPMGILSVHPWRAQFQLRYGDELELLAMLREKLGFA